MTVVNFVTFDNFLLELAKGSSSAMDISADDFEVYLTNATPNRATHTTKADLAEITSKNGYAGAATLTVTARGINSNAYRIVASDPATWAGTDADDNTGFGPFRYVILLNKSSNATPANRLLMGYWAYPSSITVADGDFFKLDLSATNGVLRLVSSGS
jgi:hypothetical protein